MRIRTLTLALLALTLLATGAWAMPSVDSPKGADERLPWQARSTFSALHDDDAAYRSRWSGWGSFDEARTILMYALRNEPGYGDQQRYQHYVEALRQAAGACGDAAKYRRLITVLAKAGDASTNYRDCAQAMRAGVDFLVNGSGGPSVCQGILMMGLSMVRGEMSSYENAYKMLFSVITESMVEAQQENPQWYSILSFTRTGVDQCKSWRNGYLVMERIGFTVANAQANTTVFMAALAGIAGVGIDSAEDLYKVMVAGLRQYERDVPSRTHKLLASYLVACADKIRSWQAAKELLCQAVTKMQNLSFDAPAAKVLLQAGLDLSVLPSGSDEDRCTVAREALVRVRSLDVPQHIGSMLDMTLRGVDAARTWYDAVQVARRGMSDLLTM